MFLYIIIIQIQQSEYTFGPFWYSLVFTVSLQHVCRRDPPCYSGMTCMRNIDLYKCVSYHQLSTLAQRFPSISVVELAAVLSSANNNVDIATCIFEARNVFLNLIHSFYFILQLLINKHQPQFLHFL